MENVREKWKECRKPLTLDNRFIVSCVVSAPNEITRYGVLDLKDFQEEYYTIQELSLMLNAGIHIRGIEPDGAGIAIKAVDTISAIKDTFKFRLWLLNGCYFESGAGMLFKVDKNDVYLLDVSTTRQEVVVPSFVTKVAIGYDCSHSTILGVGEPLFTEGNWTYRDGSGMLSVMTYLTAKSLVTKKKLETELPFRSPFSGVKGLKRVNWYYCQVHDLSLAFAFMPPKRKGALELNVWTVGDSPILLGAFGFSHKGDVKCSPHFDLTNATEEKCTEYINGYMQRSRVGELMKDFLKSRQ